MKNLKIFTENIDNIALKQINKYKILNKLLEKM